MSNAGLSQGGARIALRNILGLEPADRWVLKLYTNDKHSAFGDTADNYDEATNYETVTLALNAWVVRNSGPVEATYPEIIFTPLSAGKRMRVYGYFVVQEQSEQLMWAERFDAPDAPYYDVDEIAVNVRFKLPVKKEAS